MATVIEDPVEGQNKKKVALKGFGWAEEEKMALGRASASACNYSSIGANMSKKDLSRMLRSAFIKDFSRPSHACTTGKDSGEL